MFSKESIVFIMGVVLVVFPYLGIPESWRLVGTSIFGGVLIFVGYALRRAVYLHEIDTGNGERGTNAFVETTETLFNDVR